MTNKFGRFETVAVGDLFSKIDKYQSTWEVIDIVIPAGHRPHARLACVDRPSDRRMISISALRDKRLYIDAGTTTRPERDHLPIDEPHIEIPAAASARQERLEAEAKPAPIGAKAEPDPVAVPEEEARTANPAEGPKKRARVASESRRKTSMRAVFDRLEHDDRAA